MIILFEVFGILFFLGLLSFFVSIILRDNGIADIAWGCGFILICWYLFFKYDFLMPQLLLLFAVTLWGGRLAVRIALRKRLRSGEDARYAKWRKEWGKWFILRSYFQIYLLQPFLLLINASVLILFLSVNHIEINLISYLGAGLWFFGFIFEIIGDYQLDQFYKKKSSTKFLASGLWRYTRHPNYFGEVVLWWGIYLFAAPTVGWMESLPSPVIISFLILFVSGIPLAEERKANDPDYIEYKKRTSVFIPLPPRN